MPYFQPVESTELYAENPVLPSIAVATGDNSVALGEGAHALADNSLAIGDQSLPRHVGAVVVANGRFGSSGDCQAGKYILRTNTVNATSTEMFLDGTGGSQRLVLPDDSTWSFSVMITGHRTDASDGHAGYAAKGVIYRVAGAASTQMQGIVSKVVISESNGQWDINITSDPVNGSLKIMVQGQAGKIIRWMAVVDTAEITN